MGEALLDLDLGGDIQEDGDFLGGHVPFETDVYDFTIVHAYLNASKGGARALNLTAKDSSGKEFRETFYYTSGTQKGCKPFYVKDGVKKFLPGYTAANNLCLLAGGVELQNMPTEEAVIKLYDYEAKKELPTTVTMCKSLIGKPITAAIMKTIEDKTKKDDAGVYQPTGETRVVNTVKAFFRTRDGLTVVEIKAHMKEPEFKGKWIAKWKGQTEDKSSKTAGNAGLVTNSAAGGNAGDGTVNLF